MKNTIIFNNTDIKLINYFLTKNTNFIELNELSNYINISDRNIRYIIDRINTAYSEEIFCIENSIIKIKNIQNLIDSIPNNLSFYSANVKKRFIIYYISFNKIITINEICKLLDISRSTAKSYIKELNKYIMESYVKINNSNKGIFLDGKYENIFSLKIKLLNDFNHLDKIQEIILYSIIMKVIDSPTNKNIEDFIKTIQKQKNKLYSQHDFENIKNNIIILLFDIKNNFYKDFLINYDEIKLSDFLLVKLNLYIINYDIKIPQSAICYISKLISSYNVNKKNNFEYELLVTKIISLYAKETNANIINDQKLYNDLLNHFSSLSNRIFNDNLINNNEFDFIKNEYPLEFAIMKSIMNEFNFFNSNNYNDEISLLTVHFISALKRNFNNNQKWENVVIVSRYGNAINNIILQKINSIFVVNIISCIPTYELKNILFEYSIDGIITIENCIDKKSVLNKEVINIEANFKSENFTILKNKLKTKEYKQINWIDIKTAILKHGEINNEQLLYNDLNKILGNNLIIEEKQFEIFDLLKKDNILIYDDIGSWENAINVLGLQGVRQKDFDLTYVDSSIKSFQNYGDYMLLNDNIAIPHSKNQDNVYLTSFYMLITKKTVTFNHNSINIFILFSSKDNNEHLQALTQLSNMSQNKKFIYSLINCINNNDVLNILKQLR